MMMMMTTGERTVASSPFSCHAGEAFALIITNSPLVTDLTIWSQASVRVCADGAANHVYAADPTLVPEFIIGDLDSVAGHLLAYYSSKGTVVVPDNDMDVNDFSKCVRYLVETHQGPKLPIVVLDSLSGRFDQLMANANVLLAVILLPQGKHHILLDPQVEERVCGLIPLGEQRVPLKCNFAATQLSEIGCPAVLTTSGLKWNLNEQVLSFGGLISTSNEWTDAASGVHVETSQAILWTVLLRPK